MILFLNYFPIMKYTVMTDYEPGFCDPTNFSQTPSLSVGGTERFRASSESFTESGPWWASNQPQNLAWEENTRFYELQAGRQNSAFAAPSPPKVRRAEEQKLAQLNIPRSYMDFYPSGVYTRRYGYGDYIDQPEDAKFRESFTGQAPWYASEDPWYSTNYADNIDYGTYESKRYQPIFRAASEARTQELAAMYNNGMTPGTDIAIDNRQLLTQSANPRSNGLNARDTRERFSPIPPHILAQIPAWCQGACQRRYAQSLMQSEQAGQARQTEHLMAGSPYTIADKKKRTRGF